MLDPRHYRRREVRECGAGAGLEGVSAGFDEGGDGGGARW